MDEFAFEYMGHKVVTGASFQGLSRTYVGYWRIADPRDVTNTKIVGSTEKNYPSIELAIESAAAGARKDVDEFN